MEKRSYDQLLSSLGGTEALSMLKLGVAFFKINQTGSPKDIKLDKSAKDPILKARAEIGRKMKVLYCNPNYVTQSRFKEEELLNAPDIALLRERSGFMTTEMMKNVWECVRNNRPWHGIN